ncbi:MAG: thiol oxidoreductase, partial [Cytophagales bacterium]|nr:thiol oxidoreductase [Cytophagales bacterium]
MKRSVFRAFPVWFGMGLVIMAGCKKDNPSPTTTDTSSQDVYQGGVMTVFDGTLNAFGNQYTGLSSKQSSDFINGNSFFRNNWVAPGATTMLRDGLGPLLNGASCSSCHLLDGRGKPDFDEGLLLRLSIQKSAGVYADEPNYGGQFNHRSIAGVTSEGTPTVVYSDISGQYPDGTTYSLRKPTYGFASLNYGPMDPNVLVSPRVGQQVFGLGLLEAISETQLLENQDPYDTNGDSISGRPNYITDPATGQKKIGKIGWKANVPDLLAQTSGAFLGD